MSTMDDNKFGKEFLDPIKDWIAENLKPDDVFGHDQLVNWAESNGYVENED